jgi:hypothetical protein
MHGMDVSVLMGANLANEVDDTHKHTHTHTHTHTHIHK